MKDFITEFINTINQYYDKLAEISEKKSELPPAPGKWSPKEIIGHLIDSASNNHQRFVRIQFKDDMFFPVYIQDNWVSIQNYKHESWEQLINLWKYYNLHIAHVVGNIPPDLLNLKITKYKSEDISWIPATDENKFTLDYLIRDYEGHLRHHLNQVFLKGL